jgi:hypothetical protein
MLLPSSGPTNSAGFSDYQSVYTNRPQCKPLIYSMKIEAACSTGMFVRISKTASHRDTTEKNLNINNLFSIGDVKSRSEKRISNNRYTLLCLTSDQN